MNLFSMLVLGLLSIAFVFLGSWIGRKIPSSAKAYTPILAVGVLVYFLVKAMGDASTQALTALPATIDSFYNGQQWATAVLVLLAGVFLGLGLSFFLSRLYQGLTLFFWIATGFCFFNLGQCLIFNKIFSPPVSLGAGVLVILMLHNLVEGFAITAPLIKENRFVSMKVSLLFSLLVSAPYCYRLGVGAFWTTASLSLLTLSVSGGIFLYTLIDVLKNMNKKTIQDSLLVLLAVGFMLGWMTDSIPGKPQMIGMNAVDPDGDSSFKPIPWLPLTPDEVKSQDQASNDVLHEKSMPPQVLPDGTKKFDLTASAFTWQLFDNTRITVWGYNGQVPGPLIRLKVGDKVAVVVKNELPQSTTVHWHGLAVPNAQDGVPGITQPAIAPGGVYTYRFVVTPQMVGTHLYHSHVNDDFQVDKGLHGVLIVDPAVPEIKKYDVDAVYEIASYKVSGSETENQFVLDGKSYPEAPALRVPLGAKVRLRLVNASAEENHVMHLHGYTFKIIALDGNLLAQPISANTVLLAPSQTADIALTASNPGIWMFHCHILDHMINPSRAGDGSENRIASMGGLMTYVDVVPGGVVQTQFLPACSLTTDPTCSKP